MMIMKMMMILETLSLHLFPRHLFSASSDESVRVSSSSHPSIHPSIVSHPYLWPTYLPTYLPSTVPSRYGTVMMRIASIRSPGCMKDMVRRWMACLFIHLVSSMPTSRQITLWWSYHGDAAGGDGGDDDDVSDDHYDNDGIRFDHHGGSDADEMADMHLMIIFYDVLISCFDLIIIIFCISPFNFIMHAGNYMVSIANGGWHFLDINKQTCLSKVEIVDIDWFMHTWWLWLLILIDSCIHDGSASWYWLIHIYMMVVIVDIDWFIHTWW